MWPILSFIAAARDAVEKEAVRKADIRYHGVVTEQTVLNEFGTLTEQFAPVA
jgi:hypothetical protein